MNDLRKQLDIHFHRINSTMNEMAEDIVVAAIPHCVIRSFDWVAANVHEVRNNPNTDVIIRSFYVGEHHIGTVRASFCYQDHTFDISRLRDLP